VNAPAFELPAELEAREPPEARGLQRDEVRLLVASRSQRRLIDARFHDLPDFLRPHDLLVVNVSATLPASVAGTRGDGAPVRVHFATRAPHLTDSWFVIELRSGDGAEPAAAGRVGDRIALRGGAVIELVAPYASGARLMLARTEIHVPIVDYLMRHGEPIRYGYVTEGWPLEAYQTVYARTPGSAEMPSAGRPFTTELIARLAADGIRLAPITLHAGVSSPEHHEPPFPEQYEVPEQTARLVAETREAGGRVLAVGTTAMRALETVARPDGSVDAGAGWTNLVITPVRGLLAVDGLITGWHEPKASHLWLLEAVAGRPLLERCYDAALARGYLWHEFGDSHLVLP
jgi:S-adenosylmethionine:tRNA ribosyltransferase-isomerase